MKIITIIYLISSFICMIIDIPYYVEKRIVNVPIGLFLIFCPILNVIYSVYLIINYKDIIFKNFF